MFQELKIVFPKIKVKVQTDKDVIKKPVPFTALIEKRLIKAFTWIKECSGSHLHSITYTKRTLTRNMEKYNI
jgi:hypothetical protein